MISATILIGWTFAAAAVLLLVALAATLTEGLATGRLELDIPLGVFRDREWRFQWPRRRWLVPDYLPADW